MDGKLKQRVTGAVILTSLAVILIPVLLDGNEQERQEIINQIPEPPRIDLDDVTVEEITARMEEMERASEARLPQEVVDETDYEEADDFILDKNSIPVSWSIQLASFKNKDNATRLRAQLREKNYRSYILHGISNDEDVYRVFVGPMVSKESLAELGDEIEASMKLKGRIVRYDIAEDPDQLGG